MLARGVPLRGIAGRTGTTASALHRHKLQHLPGRVSEELQRQQLVAPDAEAEVARESSLLDQLNDLGARAQAILERAEASDRLPTALQAIKEIRGILELLAKITGDVKQTHVNIHLHPEVVQLQALILSAVDPYPEARARLIEVFEHEGADH